MATAYSSSFLSILQQSEFFFLKKVKTCSLLRHFRLIFSSLLISVFLMADFWRFSNSPPYLPFVFLLGIHSTDRSVLCLPVSRGQFDLQSVPDMMLCDISGCNFLIFFFRLEDLYLGLELSYKKCKCCETAMA